MSKSTSGSPLDEPRTVFCTGAPGSTWSVLLGALATCENVDRSDERPDRVYGRHFGNYFGPHMEFGEYFDDMPGAGASRDSLIAEFDKPYSAEPNGKYRLLKSHHFAYNLDFLRSTFPDARAIFIARPDDTAMDWWLEAGGFGISYPKYDWYENDARMRRQIAIENQAIASFTQRAGVRMERMPLVEVADRLGLRVPDDRSHWPTLAADVTIGVL